MKKILKKIGLIALCLTLMVLYIVGVRALWSMDGAKKANSRPKNTASEVVTTFEEAGGSDTEITEPETTEPETSSPVVQMYRHTVTITNDPSGHDPYNYTFEVLSSSSTEFEAVSDIPDGTYSCTREYFGQTETCNGYIDQGEFYIDGVDDNRYALWVSGFTDAVTFA